MSSKISWVYKYSLGISKATEIYILTLFHNPRRLGCDSPTGTCWKLHTVSFTTTAISNTIGCAGIFVLSGRVACSAMRTCCRAILYFQPYSKLAPSTLPDIWAGAVFLGVECVASKAQGGLTVIVVVAASCTNLSFTLKGMSWHTPDHRMCRNFTELASAWIFVEFVSLPLECICLQHASTLLLILPDHHDVISVMYQYDILWNVQVVQMSSG